MPEEEVPSYEILEEKLPRAIVSELFQFLIDTPATSEADYTLIAREIKHKYQDFDAASAEFTDTADDYSYNGVAVILTARAAPGSWATFTIPPATRATT